MSQQLIVVTGATASGKTTLAIELAQRLNTEIISADSRQIYNGLPIGTAQPSPQERLSARHHLIDFLPVDSSYSAARFQDEALDLLPGIFHRGNGKAILAGGAMMYIDALCHGIDDLPTVSPEIRTRAYELFELQGLDKIIEELKVVDPQYLAAAPDLNNHKRLIHALEVSWQAGKPYSSLLSGKRKPRPFAIVKFALDLPRPTLFDRINRRVDLMMQQGLLDEARRMYPLRHLNSLNTVGYKELFAYFDGKMDLETAVERIKKNTRVYAKKQLTWLKRDPEVIWIPAIDEKGDYNTAFAAEKVFSYLCSK